MTLDDVLDIFGREALETDDYRLAVVHEFDAEEVADGSAND